MNLRHRLKLSKFNRLTMKADAMPNDPRGERLQIMLTKDELTAVDGWRFNQHMPGLCGGARATAAWTERRRLRSCRWIY